MLYSEGVLQKGSDQMKSKEIKGLPARMESNRGVYAHTLQEDFIQLPVSFGWTAASNPFLPTCLSPASLLHEHQRDVKARPSAYLPTYLLMRLLRQHLCMC